MKKARLCFVCLAQWQDALPFRRFSGTPDIVSLRNRDAAKTRLKEIIDDVSTVKLLAGGKREVVYSYIEKDANIFRGLGYFLGSTMPLFCYS